MKFHFLISEYSIPHLNAHLSFSVDADLFLLIPGRTFKE